MFQFGIHWKITSIYVDKHALNSWYTLHKFVAKDISWKKFLERRWERRRSVWKTSRVSENVRSVSQANEWTNLYEWTRLLATALLLPTVQRCSSPPCKDALPSASAVFSSRGDSCLSADTPAHWLANCTYPRHPHSQNLPLIHKSCPSFTKITSHSQKEA